MPDDLKEYMEQFPDTVPLRVAVKMDMVTEEHVETYVATVQFLAWWLEQNDGARGMSTAELLDQFRDNVCAVMARGAVRT